MSNQKETKAYIEINGTRYDAYTGRVVSSPQAVISDFVSSPASTVKTVAAAKAAPVESITAPAKKVMDIVRPASQGHVKHHHQQPAKTLMRSTVKKPATTSLKRHHKAVTRTDILVTKPVTRTVKPKISYYSVDAGRATRAQLVARHQNVQRFATTKPAPIVLAAAHVEQPYGIPVGQIVRPQQQSMDVFARAMAQADAHLEPALSYHQLSRAERKAAKQGRRQTLRRGFSLLFSRG